MSGFHSHDQSLLGSAHQIREISDHSVNIGHYIDSALVAGNIGHICIMTQMPQGAACAHVSYTDRKKSAYGIEPRAHGSGNPFTIMIAVIYLHPPSRGKAFSFGHLLISSVKLEINEDISIALVSFQEMQVLVLSKIGRAHV